MLKDIPNVHTFADLLEVIARDYPDKSLKDVATKIGIGDKSYFNIKNGVVPKQKLLRSIKSFVEREYGLKLEVINGTKIKLKSITVNNGGTVSIANVQMDDRTKYLLDKIIELEKEKQELLDKLNKKK